MTNKETRRLLAYHYAAKHAPRSNAISRFESKRPRAIERKSRQASVTQFKDYLSLAVTANP